VFAVKQVSDCFYVVQINVTHQWLNRLHSYMGSAVKYLEDYKPVYTHCDRENVQQAACYRNMCLLRREEKRRK
jgi:hypothetical protein